MLLHAAAGGEMPESALSDLRRRSTRGFTLVEMMVVVVIIGVLSVIALFAYRKYEHAARNAEAEQFLGAIRVAQESYFQSFGQYAGNANPSRWPVSVPTIQKEPWDPVGEAAFQQLNVSTPGRVWFQYMVVAGRAGENPPGGAPFRPGEVDNRPWFFAAACGDFNNNANGAVCGTQATAEGSRLSYFETSSVRPDIVRFNEGQ